MNRTLTSLLGLVVFVGCQQDSARDLSAKLDEIDGRLANIERGLKARPSVAGRRRPNAKRNNPNPNPKDVFAVPIADAPFKGSKDAAVTVVKAFEFACPYCERARPTMDQLLKDYGDDIKVVYKHFVVHPNSATIPAIAACAAGRQGKFAEMEEAIWARGFSKARSGGLGRANIDKLAQEIGLDMDRYGSDTKSCQSQVRRDQSELSKIGTRATPAFYINGRFLSGAQPVANFKKVIDEELAKAKTRVAKGTPADRYYEEWVLKKGKKKL